MSRFAIVLLVVLLSAPRNAAAEAPPALDKGLPVQGSSIALQPVTSGYEAVIPIDPEKGITDVTVSSTDDALAPMLSRVVVNDAQGRPRLLKITVGTGALRQGPHPLTLTAATQAGPLLRDVSLVVPEVKLDPPDPLVIVRLWPDWLPRSAMRATEPQLWTASRGAWLTGITVKQRGDTDAGGLPAGRVVAKAGHLPDIPPGGDTRLVLGRDFDLNGSFPLGTAKGKLVIEADQLAQSVAVPFEVRSRMLGFWLIVAIMAGLLAGYLTRIWLQKRLALNQERLQTFALIDIMAAALAANADPTFVAAATQARDEASAAVRSDDVKAIQAETATARDRFQKALDALQQRRSELDQAIARLSSVISPAWRVPPAVTQDLNRAKSLLETGGLSGLASNNVAAATEALGALRAEIAKQTVNAGRSWLDAQQALDALFSAAAPLLGADYAASLAAGVAALRAPLESALKQLEDDPTATPERLQAMLQAFHADAVHLPELLGSAKVRIRQQVQRWDARLSGRLSHPELWDAWVLHAGSFADALADAASDPDARVGTLAGDWSKLAAEFGQALKAQVGDSGPVEAALKEGKYDDAVARVADAIPARAAALTRRLPTAPALAETSPPWGLVPSSLVVPSPSPIALAAPARGLPSLAVLAALTRGTVETTGRLLWFSYAAVIVVAGYFLYDDKWVGTPLDWATVFFWAWGTDVGADAATNAVKGLRKA